jgi:hypothetical protein
VSEANSVNESVSLVHPLFVRSSQQIATKRASYIQHTMVHHFALLQFRRLS